MNEVLIVARRLFGHWQGTIQLLYEDGLYRIIIFHKPWGHSILATGQGKASLLTSLQATATTAYGPEKHPSYSAPSNGEEP